MNRKATITAVAAALTLAIAAGSIAATLKIGDAAPNWSGLKGTDGKLHSLSDYKQAKALVVVFTCNHCPVAKAYEDRLIALQKAYKDRGVQMVGINSNSPDVQPQDSFEKMQARAAGKDLGSWRKEKGPFSFPYLFDATQQVARDYGATCTPHVFVLDKDRKVVYMGAVDDNNNPEKVKQHYLRDALDAVLAGRVPAKTVTRQRGCTIKWKTS